MFYNAWKMRLSATECVYTSGLASGGYRGSAPTVRWGDEVSQALCAHPTSKLWLYSTAFTAAGAVKKQVWKLGKSGTVVATRVGGVWQVWSLWYYPREIFWVQICAIWYILGTSGHRKCMDGK